MSKTVFEELSSQSIRGVLLVLTGPSGAGKDTVLTKIQSLRPNTLKIITTTTRAPREQEHEGKAHHFISREEFEHKIGSGEFFEWVEFRGELYGTTKTSLQEALNSGNDVLWRIDMKGVKNIKEKVLKMTKRAVFIFITAPSMEELERRVKKAEGENTTRWKPDLVAWELHQYDDCDYVVVNPDEDFESSATKILAVMDAKRLEVFPEE